MVLTVPTPQAAALSALKRAAEASPSSPAAWAELGRALRLAGDLAGAEAAYRRAIGLDPATAQTFLGLGLCLKAQARLPEAAEAYRRAIRADPAYADAFHNLGNVLADLGRATPALMAYRAALKRKPEHAGAHIAYGALLRRVGRPIEGLKIAERSLVLAPNLAAAHFQHANTLAALERPEAEAAYRRAIALTPDWAEPHFSLAVWLLREGRLREGFAEYEWRWARPSARELAARLPHPVWRGEPVEGKVMLVTVEQGLGDAIQCARFLPLLARRGATVLVEAKPATRDLLKTIQGVTHVVEPGNFIDRLDFQCPLFSLPHAFGVDLDSVPANVPYIHPPQALVARWRAELPEAPRRIGLVWQGNPNSKVEKGRSFPLAAMKPLFAAAPDAAFVSLQHENGLDQLADPVVRIPGFEAGTLLDTAALIASLDLVIACDTAVAHLAGALGKPVWIALKTPAEWRWLRSRADSPWYTSARLYRQGSPGDWPSVFEAVARDLTA